MRSAAALEKTPLSLHRSSSVEEVCALMGIAPDWAKGLPLRADGYECDFYKKD